MAISDSKRRDKSQPHRCQSCYRYGWLLGWLLGHWLLSSTAVAVEIAVIDSGQQQVTLLPPPPAHYRVAAGDTLSAIAAPLAERYQQPLAPLLLLLFEQNRHAFRDDNINRLQQGALLQFPTAAQIAAVRGGPAASSEVARHWQRWQQRDIADQPAAEGRPLQLLPLPAADPAVTDLQQRLTRLRQRHRQMLSENGELRVRLARLEDQLLQLTEQMVQQLTAVAPAVATVPPIAPAPANAINLIRVAAAAPLIDMSAASEPLVALPPATAVAAAPGHVPAGATNDTFWFYLSLLLALLLAVTLLLLRVSVRRTRRLQQQRRQQLLEQLHG